MALVSTNKITAENILELNSENLNELNEKVKILIIKYFLDLSRELKEETFPNVFVIIVEDDDAEEIEVKSKITKIFSKCQQILLQLNSKNFLKCYKENFVEIKFNLSEHEIEDNFKNSKFTTQMFLKVQEKQKINSIEFDKFLKYEKSALKIFLNTQDEFCLKLLSLFDLKFSHADEKKNFESIIEKEFFETFNQFKSIKNEDLEFTNLIRKGEQILCKIEKLHENIENNDLDEVKNFCDENPKLKLCYGLNNISALELAIDCKNFELYSFLRAKGFCTNKPKALEEKIRKLSETQKNIIKMENLKYAQEFPNAFILLKCKFDALSPISATDVQEMLNDLSKIDNLKPLLQIASQADLKITFDFANESIKSMIPGATEVEMGLADYKRGLIYVGKDASKHLRYGCFMHELTHLVLFLIYENRCLPYCEGDTEREEEWNSTLSGEEENFKANAENVEPIIQWVFRCYSDTPSQLVPELAVRPNHILARYFDDDGRVKEIKEMHTELFYHWQNVLEDLRIKNVLRLVKINKDFRVIKRTKNSKLKLEKDLNQMEILKDKSGKLFLTSNVAKLALLKLLTNLEDFSENKLDVKVKNIFVDPEKLHLISLRKEFYDLVKSSKIDRVIFDLTDAKHMQNVLMCLQDLAKVSQIILVGNEESYQSFENYERVHVPFNFYDLSSESKEIINEKELKFQRTNFKVSELFNLISDEIFPHLCDDREIALNSICDRERFESYFVDRTIQQHSMEYNLKNFLEEVQEEKIVLISSAAGNGKTTLLRKINENFLEEFPNHWISFISLIDHVKELSNTNQRLQEILLNILQTNIIEKEIFNEKFAKGEVKILFDGFDEISPKCKDQTLKLFKALKAQDKNQIFITTRCHLEKVLQDELKIESFTIKVLPESDQIEFLCNFWKHSHVDENFIKRCAEQLTQKLFQLIKNYQDLIGIPMIIQSVAKLYVDKINENFENEIKILNISKVFEKIIEEYLNTFNLRFSSNLIRNSFKRTSILQAHEYFTVVHYFDEDFANSLGLSHNKFEWPVEEIVRCGILTYDEKGMQFNHETYGQNFLASILINFLKNCNTLTNQQFELLTKVLSENRFEIARMFLDEMLKESEEQLQYENLFKNEENLKIFKCVKDRNHLNVLKLLMNSNLKDFNTFGMEVEEFLCNISKETESSEFFNKSLILVHKSLNEGYFENFLLKLKPNGLLVLESFLKNLKDEKIGKILLHQTQGKTLLNSIVKDSETLYKVLEKLKENVCNEVLRKLFHLKDDGGQNVLMISTYDNENSFKILLEFLRNLLTRDQMRQFLCEVDKKENMILHFSALYLSSKESFELLFYLICESVENPKEFLVKRGDLQKIPLQLAARNQENSEIFTFLFNKSKELYDNEELKALVLQKNLNNDNLFTIMINFKTEKEFESVLKIFNGKINEILKTSGEYGRSLMSMAMENKEKEMIVYLWKTLRLNLNREEIILLLRQKDEYGDNVLNFASWVVKSKENFEFLRHQIKETFGDKDQLKEYLEIRCRGRNILHRSVEVSNENSFYFIFEKIYCQLYDIREFIYEIVDNSGNNIFHLLARHSSVSMIKFAFDILNDKLSNDELKNFLMTSGKKFKNNIFHCVAMRKENSQADSQEILECLLKEIKKHLSKNDIKLLLNGKTTSDLSPLNPFIRSNTLENFQCFMNIYKNYFTKTEIKNIFEEINFRELANENKTDERIINATQNFYQELCTEK